MISKICLVVFRNLAEFEYLIPIIEKNKCKLDIIVLDYSKNDLIEENSILKHYCRKNNISIFDIRDFLKNKSFFFNLLSKKISSKSISIKSLLSILRKKFTIDKLFLLIEYVFNFLLKKIYNFIFFKMQLKNFAKDYDFVFIGHRNFKSHFFSEVFNKIFLKRNLKFIFIPHGPHYVRKFSKYLSNTENLILNENYINISANNIEKPWLNRLINKSRCLNMGYPPFKYNSNYLEKEKFKSRKKKILVISRKFDFKKEVSRKKDGFTINFKSFSVFMDNLKLIDTNKFEIYLKPHPTTDINLLRQFLKENNLDNLKILFDPMLFYVKSFDLIYSYHSSLLLLGIANSIPVIYYEDKAVKKDLSWHKKYLDFYKLSYLIKKKNTKLDKYFKNANHNYNFKKLHKNKLKLFKNFKDFRYKNFFVILNKQFRENDKTIY